MRTGRYQAPTSMVLNALLRRVTGTHRERPAFGDPLHTVLREHNSNLLCDDSSELFDLVVTQMHAILCGLNKLLNAYLWQTHPVNVWQWWVRGYLDVTLQRMGKLPSYECNQPGVLPHV
jgi:hypothetical protein